MSAALLRGPWPPPYARRPIYIAPQCIKDVFAKSIEVFVARSKLRGAKDPKKHGWDVAMHLQKAGTELRLLVQSNREKIHVV